ncbi:Triple Functional Domain Protein [Manis pentadactyla]|nr:Triple Functional Domain Protein [Manis pentadactyla]
MSNGNSALHTAFGEPFPPSSASTLPGQLGFGHTSCLPTSASARGHRFNAHLSLCEKGDLGKDHAICAQHPTQSLRYTDNVPETGGIGSIREG